MLKADIKLWGHNFVRNEGETIVYPRGKEFYQESRKYFKDLMEEPTKDWVDKLCYCYARSANLLEVSEFLENNDIDWFEIGRIRLTQSFLETVEKGKLTKPDPEHHFNKKVNVHISNMGLLEMQSVYWLEDACTEDLQHFMDDGWRILGVCPQPDQRRPDYILGHKELNKEKS